MPRSFLIIIAVTALLSTGCQMPYSPGSLLPSFAMAQQDRSIKEYAANSGFPSPQDVGLTGDDDSQ